MMRTEIRKHLNLIFVVLSLGSPLLFFGCGALDQKEIKMATVSVSAEAVPAQSQSLADFASIQSTTMPSSVTDFNCLVLNVTGAPGISVQQNLGLVSSMIPVTNGGVMSVLVPQGAGITFQVLGVKTSNSCGFVGRDQLLNTTNYTVIAELGRTVATINRDTDLTISSTYNSATASDVRGASGTTPSSSTSTPIGSAPVRPDGCLDDFVSQTAMSIYHQYGAAVSIGSKLYIIGGRLGANSTDQRGITTNKVWEIPIASDGTPGAIAETAYTLTAGRHAHRAEKIGNYVYVFGGATAGTTGTADGTVLDTVERAPANDSGITGNFEPVAGVTLATTTFNAYTLVTPGYIYVLGGGTGGTSYSTTIQRAPINTTTGAITGTFSTIAQTLVTGRGTHNGMRLGDNVYILGGEGLGGSLSSVESFTVNSDGTITDPATVAGVTLGTARNRVQTVALSGKAYAFAGWSGSFLSTVAVANITTNTLGNFSISATVSLRNAVENVTSILTAKGAYIFGGYDTHARNYVQFAPIITCP